MSQSGGMSSQELSSRQVNKGRSLGLSYSYDDNPPATDSLDDSELRQLAATGTLKMSVTLPSIGGDDESLSEIDITDPTYSGKF